MFEELLTKAYYGNTVSEWAIAFGIILGAVIIGKLLYWVFGNIIKAFTSRTKTKLDDILIDMIEEPILLAIVIGGMWYGQGRLIFSETAGMWVNNILQVLIAICVTWFIARLLDALFKEYLVPFTEKSESDLDDQLLPIVSKGTKIIVWTLGIIVALNNAGYNVGAVLAGLGIGGLALAMAAKDTVSNIFGGFTIFMDKPFKLKDRIKISGFDGTVKEIGLRSTRMTTLEGREVTIPNKTFAESPVENVTREPSRKIVLNLGLTYDTKPKDMQKAMDILKDIHSKNKSVEEKVLLSFNAFGDFSLGILFIYYIREGEDILQTQTDMNMEILTQFNKNGLEFAFPTQTIYTAKA